MTYTLTLVTCLMSTSLQITKKQYAEYMSGDNVYIDTGDASCSDTLSAVSSEKEGLVEDLERLQQRLERQTQTQDRQEAEFKHRSVSRHYSCVTSIMPLVLCHYSCLYHVTSAMSLGSVIYIVSL